MAAKIKLKVEQGATFRKQFTWKVRPDKNSPAVIVDLTGYTARMQVRAEVETPGPPLLVLDTSNGGIILGGVNGTIQLNMNPTQTAALTWESGVYDLELEASNGDVKRLIQGTISVSPEVTR